MNEVVIGDCRDTMRAWIAQGVRAQMCVTSPPYWGLRDYGCDGQIGLEPTLGQWLDKMVDVFRLVREVLADDGTCWINIGDAYCHGTGADRLPTTTAGDRVPASWSNRSQAQRIRSTEGLKPKDLTGQPWRLAFALQDDGWYLRSDIIWHKPNPMPESITDRPTKAHEYLFLLAKSERYYYYDAEAIKEAVTGGSHARGNGVNPKASGTGVGFGHGYDPLPKQRAKTPNGWDTSIGEGGHGTIHKDGRASGTPRNKQNESFSGAVSGLVDNRNKRTVWTIPTQAYSEAHFATFPEALVEPCIMAGSRVGDVVLDPFFGSGTVGQVAQNLGRRWIGCELNPEYARMSERRTAQSAMDLVARPTTLPRALSSSLSDAASGSDDRAYFFTGRCARTGLGLPGRRPCS